MTPSELPIPHPPVNPDMVEFYVWMGIAGVLVLFAIVALCMDWYDEVPRDQGD